MATLTPDHSDTNRAASPGRVTIAVLSDVHYGTASALSLRRNEIADILLLRAVRRLNRLIHPDVTLLLGDLVDDGRSTEAAGRLATLRGILDKLQSPWIVIPGNHDGDPEAFYQVFDRPGASVDLCGVRFLPFVDREEPGYNASRRPEDIGRFQLARADWRGPLVALQHVCLAPPLQSAAPYNYINAPEIIRAMTEAGVSLSISGHHHHGAESVRNETTTFVTAPGLCEAPFPFLLITVEGERITVERQQLAMPAQLGLVDTHVHSELAYCGENVSVSAAIPLAKEFGLAGMGFSEHSGQLYYDERSYWAGQWFEEGIAGAKDADNRMPGYLSLIEDHRSPGVSFGLEVDYDAAGKPLLRPEHRGQFDHLIGSIHRLPSLYSPSVRREILEDEFMGLLEQLVKDGIDIVAHPFRVLRRGGLPVSERLFRPAATLLRKHGVAMEINFHNNQPPVEFVRLCLEMGIRFSLGSDSHNLCEIGEFADHLQLLREAGFTGELSDVLLPRPRW